MSRFECPGHLEIEVWQPSEPSSDHPYSPSSSPPPPLPSPHSRNQVYLRIFFELECQFIDCLHDGSTTCWGSSATPRRERSCWFNICCFLRKSDGSYETILEMLYSLGLDEEAAHESIEKIFSKGRRDIVDIWTWNKGPRIIPLRVEIKKTQHVWVNYDRYLTHMAMRESMREHEATNYGMVPARKSSMRRLLETGKVLRAGEDDGRGKQESKRKRRRLGSESCSICLEEFEVGSSATFMPCSHGFHKDCIFKWLEQSHYCPICRFEMPTNHN